MGVEGLTTYKYKLRGNGHIVAEYSSGSPFQTQACLVERKGRLPPGKTPGSCLRRIFRLGTPLLTALIAILGGSGITGSYCGPVVRFEDIALHHLLKPFLDNFQVADRSPGIEGSEARR